MLAAALQAGIQLQPERAYRMSIDLHRKYVQVRIEDVGPLGSTMHGDVDNYCKSIMDGINGLPGWDDRQVVEVEARKEWEAERKRKSTTGTRTASSRSPRGQSS